MKNSCLICGSFNPMTLGHVDLVSRAAKLYGSVHVVLMHNANKVVKASVEIRLEIMRRSLSALDNVTVAKFGGLAVDYARANDIGVIVKGVRNSADYQYEIQQAHFNLSVGGIETLFLPSSSVWDKTSSSMVRELVNYGVDVGKYVNRDCIELIKKLYGQESGITLL